MPNTLTKTFPETSAYAPPADNGLSLGDLLAIVKRHLIFIVVCALVCLSLGVLYIFLAKPVYEASATVRLDPGRAGSLGVSELGAGPTDSASLINTEIGVLESDGVARRTLASLSDDEYFRLTQTHRSPTSFSQEELAMTREEQEILNDFETNLLPKQVEGAQLITVSFRNPDPELAASIVNHIVSAYTIQTFVDRDNSVTQLRTWLSAQMATLKNQVDASQKKLSDFQEANDILGTSATSTTTSDRLKLLNQTLAEAQENRILKDAQLRAAKTGDVGAIAALYPNPQLESLQREQAVLYTRASQLSSKFGPNYPPLVEVNKEIQTQNEQIKAAVRSVQQRLQQEFDVANTRQNMLQKEYDDQTQVAFSVNRNQGEFDVLQAEVTSSREMYDTLRRKLQQASVDAQINGLDTILVDKARVPLKPVLPKKLLVLAGSLVLGTFAGLAIAFIRDSNSDRLGISTNSLEAGAYPTLALIPRGESPTNRSLGSSSGSTALSISNSPSSTAEAYRALRNLLLLSTDEAMPKSLLVTSTQREEGSEAVAANLAAAMAHAGFQVLLVDANSRSSRMNHELGLADEAPVGEGLSHSNASADLSTRQVGGISGLSLLSLGSSGNEAFGWDRLRDSIARWSNSYDYVVMHSSPMLDSSDALLFAKWVDTVVVVCRYSSTKMRTLKETKRVLDSIRARVAGVVVSDVPRSALHTESRS